MAKILVIKGADFSEVSVSKVIIVGAPIISITSLGVVTITAVNGAVIHYTTDGTNPTTNSTTYNGVFSVSDGTVVKAVSVYGDNHVSSVISKKYDEDAWYEVDLSSMEKFRGIIDSNNVFKSSATSDGFFMVPASAGEEFKITANSSNNAVYAQLKSDDLVNNQTAPFVDGVSGRTVQTKGTTGTIVATSDCRFLYVYDGTYDTDSHLPTIYKFG